MRCFQHIDYVILGRGRFEGATLNELASAKVVGEVVRQMVGKVATQPQRFVIRFVCLNIARIMKQEGIVRRTHVGFPVTQRENVLVNKVVLLPVCVHKGFDKAVHAHGFVWLDVFGQTSKKAIQFYMDDNCHNQWFLRGFFAFSASG
jgi:hypothetical protein